MSKSPLTVCISGAAGQIGYALIPLICGGKAFGNDQPVKLHLLDIPPMMKVLGGVVMEIQDCAYPLVTDVVATADYQEAFQGCQYAILVGGFPRKKGMLRGDLLAKNRPIFSGQGDAIEKYADKGIKVLVVANPANTNAMVLQRNAPSIPKENITALTRLDMNRAVGILANRMGVSSSQVSNVTIWGNHSKTQVPDASSGYVDIDGKKQSLPDVIRDDAFLFGDFIPTIQNRGAAVIAARGLSSALSAANAIKDHVHDWYFGTKPGEYVSMSVLSDGNHYGIPDGIFYSVPLTIKDGKWKIVDGLRLQSQHTTHLQGTQQELLDEKKEALQVSKL